MRRRPLRTALTAITVVILTFTVLGFASFGSRVGVRVVVMLHNLPPAANQSFMTRSHSFMLYTSS